MTVTVNGVGAQVRRNVRDSLMRRHRHRHRHRVEVIRDLLRRRELIPDDVEWLDDEDYEEPREKVNWLKEGF